MLSPEELKAFNVSKATAIFDRFDSVEKSNELTKSEDATEVFYTAENLHKFKEDLFKGIDSGTLSEDDLNKAQEDLLSLKRETRTIEGKETEVFVKA